MNGPKPPTEDELSRWVITGATKRQDLASRLGRAIAEIRRLRAEIETAREEQADELERALAYRGDAHRVRVCSSEASE